MMYDTSYYTPLKTEIIQGFVKHVLNYYQIVPTSGLKKPKIGIIERTSRERQILNLKELVAALSFNNQVDVVVLKFGDMTIRDQVKECRKVVVFAHFSLLYFVPIPNSIVDQLGA
jgi:hypothetical protein